MTDSERLYQYIENNDLRAVKKILADIPALIEGGHLFKAVSKGLADIVRYMVEYSRISLNETDDHGRDVLHYCAASDNADLWDYLIVRCGMDPFKGDRDLNTPWELAVMYRSESICSYMKEHYGEPEEYYKNPIRTGMYPDPSIVRVGEDYYMVNSSFIFFPCIPISHSKDLIHWEIIGHAITERKWANIDDLEGGRGYWAPDISYYEGRFYITATLRYNDIPPVYRRQIIVSSDKPEGPYSEPAFIEEDGIDPSIFNDDDGRRYMLLNRGARILELDSTATRQIGEARLLYYGDMKRAPEGPHLYKKDGYYYLLLAEGGTGTGHRVTIQRSRTLMGAYEPCPYNPIMRQEDERAAIQRCGHGDMIDTPDGRWYMVYLCGRMYDDKYSILGRETAIDPVTWTADGWPVVNALKGPSALQQKPYREWNVADKKPYTPLGIPLDYMTPRTFTKGDITADVSDNVGETTAAVSYDFAIVPSEYDLSDVRNRSIVVRRQTAFDNVVWADITVPEDMTDGEELGLTGYYDENTFYTYGIVYKDGRARLRIREHIGDDDRIYITDNIMDGKVTYRLKIDTKGLRRELYLDDEIIYTLENVYYLSDEGLNRGKRFTGAMAGLYAVRPTGSVKGIKRHINGFMYRDMI